MPTKKRTPKKAKCEHTVTYVENGRVWCRAHCGWSAEVKDVCSNGLCPDENVVDELPDFTAMVEDFFDEVAKKTALRIVNDQNLPHVKQGWQPGRIMMETKDFDIEELPDWLTGDFKNIRKQMMWEKFLKKLEVLPYVVLGIIVVVALAVFCIAAFSVVREFLI